MLILHVLVSFQIEKVYNFFVFDTIQCKFKNHIPFTCFHGGLSISCPRACFHNTFYYNRFLFGFFRKVVYYWKWLIDVNNIRSKTLIRGPDCWLSRLTTHCFILLDEQRPGTAFAVSNYRFMMPQNILLYTFSRNHNFANKWLFRIKIKTILCFQCILTVFIPTLPVT